jgi:hypothetical protein
MLHIQRIYVFFGAFGMKSRKIKARITDSVVFVFPVRFSSQNSKTDEITVMQFYSGGREGMEALPKYIVSC